MKLTLTFFLIIFSMALFGQSNTVISAEQNKAQFKAAIQKELTISEEKAETVVSIILSSNTQMTVIAKNMSLDKNEKLKRFKIIAKDRDNQIAQQLTTGQINRLTTFLVNRKKLYPPKGH